MHHARLDACACNQNVEWQIVEQKQKKIKLKTTTTKVNAIQSPKRNCTQTWQLAIMLSNWNWVNTDFFFLSFNCGAHTPKCCSVTMCSWMNRRQSVNITPNAIWFGFYSYISSYHVQCVYVLSDFMCELYAYVSKRLRHGQHTKNAVNLCLFYWFIDF